MMLAGILVLVYASYRCEEVGSILLGLGGIFLFMCLLLLGITRLECNAHIAQIETLRSEIETTKINNQINVQIDRLMVKVIKENQWISEKRYYKSNPWSSWFYPATVNKVEYVDISKLKERL